MDEKGTICFRVGSRTNQALTPRPGADTVAAAGLTPGLSVEAQLEDALSSENRKAQKIDLTRLRLPLAYFPDPVGVEGARPGHGVIAPVGDEGLVDMAVLLEWASCRQSQAETPHPLTQLVIDAIVENDARLK
jgi:hypothetical protein